MIKINKLKAWAVTYDIATNTVLAIFGEKEPKFITVKLSENGMKLIEDVALEVVPATDTNLIIKGGHSVVFWDVRYVGATEEDEMLNFEAEYMLFV